MTTATTKERRRKTGPFFVDLRLLGSRSLEGFGAVIDARQKKLIAAGPYPAAI